MIAFCLSSGCAPAHFQQRGHRNHPGERDMGARRASAKLFPFFFAATAILAPCLYHLRSWTSNSDTLSLPSCAGPHISIGAVYCQIVGGPQWVAQLRRFWAVIASTVRAHRSGSAPVPSNSATSIPRSQAEPRMFGNGAQAPPIMFSTGPDGSARFFGRDLMSNRGHHIDDAGAHQMPRAASPGPVISG